MPRAIWTGAISFGLVTVPVRLYSAVSRKNVRFHQLHVTDGVRIQQKRVCPADGEEVAYEEIVKGYEIAPDRYVMIEPAELEALDPQRTHTIDIEDFVSLEEIDPIFYDHPYYLAPGPGGAKPYRLLLDAMRDTGKVAIARVVLRSKEQLVAIRPMDDVLGMATMIFSDEVVSPERLDELAATEEVQATERELGVARQLVEAQVSKFDPSRYHDTYRARVLDLIERKAQGEEIAVSPPPQETVAEVPDLMSALQASLEEVRSRTPTGADAAGGAKKAKAGGGRAGSNGAGAEGAKSTKAPRKPRAKSPAKGTRKPAAKSR